MQENKNTNQIKNGALNGKKSPGRNSLDQRDIRFKLEIQSNSLDAVKEEKKFIQVGYDNIQEEHIGARRTGYYHRLYPLGYYLR